MKCTQLALSLIVIIALGAARAVAQTPDGQALYREQCRTCHGALGKPTQRALTQTPKIPIMDSTFFATRSQDSIVAVLRHGAGRDMKAFKDKLSADEILAVARYIRTLGGSPATKP